MLRPNHLAFNVRVIKNKTKKTLNSVPVVEDGIKRDCRMKTRASEHGLTYTPGQCHRLIHKLVLKI